MGLIISKYNEEQRIDKCWYDSSNIIFSETFDKQNELKEIIIVFKGGRAYKYLNVNVNDIVLFKHGGVSGSIGKAFEQYLKKYPFEKLENYNLAILEEEKQKLLLERAETYKKLLEEQNNETT
jgi:hypothetical protein